MAKVAFIPAGQGGDGTIDVVFGEIRRALDDVRLQALLVNPEPKIQSDTWLVQTGRELFQLLPIQPEDVVADRILELDLTALPNDSSIATLPWELLHDGTVFLAQQAIPVVRIVRKVNRRSSGTENRALSLLFQACSPEHTDVLDFEKEEALILAAAHEPSIDLFTEETGTLDGLDSMIKTRAGQIDVFHLSGHATLFDKNMPSEWLAPDRPKPSDGTPVFLMENDIGRCQLATADDLSNEAFRDDWPKLVFVSGCRTGEQLGTIPSMARALVDKGVPAVIAWRRPVFDDTATRAAEQIYESLATGYTVEKSIGRALKYLTRRKEDGGWFFPDWHLLQLYRDSGVLGAPVTAPAAHGRAEAHRVEPEKSFLGDKPVAGPNQFVGRRRPVQRCLRSLLDDKAVVLWGVGGLGKSSVAARLSRRLTQRFPDTKRVVIRGRLSERILRDRLRQLKGGSIFESREALGGLLAEFLETHANLLIILDNFEDNQEVTPSSPSGFLLDGEARRVLETLAGALSDGRGRLILTTRYWDSETFPPMGPYHAESLSAMAEADVLKKQQRMDLKLDAEQAKSLAVASCGNPRFLETISQVPSEQREALREKFLTTELRFETLWANLTEQEQTDVAKLAVSTLPLPLAALETLGLNLSKAVALALVEQTEDARAVSAIARPDVPELLETDQIQVAKVIAPILHRDWRADGGFSLDHIHELLRLGLLADDADVACANGDTLATWLRNGHQWQAARQLCEVILSRFEDYRVLNTLAMVLQLLGETELAVASAIRAVELCPAEDAHQKAIAYQSLSQLQHLRGQPSAAMESLNQALRCADAMDRESVGSGDRNRAATLYQMAGVLSQQGEVERALGLWRESLEINEKIGHVQGKAATLHEMAGVLAQQGEVERALGLWRESLEIKEKIGDVKGKAATLHQMAGVLAEQGEVERALQLWRESLEIYEKIGDVKGKAATLHQMAGVVAQQGEVERALGLWRESLEIHEKVGDVQGKAATLHRMAGVLAQQGEVERALGLWRESLAIKEKIGDVQGKAATLHNVAGVLAQQGEVERALGLWRESLEIEDKIGDVQGKAATLHEMAGVLAQQGEVERALGLWRESLEIYEKIGDVKGKAATLHQMAGVVAQQGEVERALGLWRESLEIKEKIGDVQGKAATLHEMAGVLVQQGEVEQALGLWRESLEIEDKIGDVQGKAATLHNVAGVLAQQGEVERALGLWRESLEIEDKIGDVQGKAATLHEMAGVLAQQGEVERALGLWRESLEIKEKIGDVRGKAATLHNMAGVLAQQGEVERALGLWRESLEIKEKIGDVRGKAATLHNMAGVLAQQGEVERALGLWRESLEIYEKIGDVKGKAATLHQMAGVLVQQGEVEQALGLWRESLEIKEKIGDVKGKAATLHNMAGVLAQQGEVERALGLWRESLEIKEKIGDVRGKAATLANMGWAYGKSGDQERQLECNLDAARSLATIRAYPDLVSVVGNLGATDQEKSEQWMAQAVWLGRHIQIPPAQAIQLIEALFHSVPTGHRLERNLALFAIRSAIAQAGRDGADSPGVQTAFRLAAVAAQGAGVAPEDFKNWLDALMASDPEQVDRETDDHLVALIGESWIFDPKLVPRKSKSSNGGRINTGEVHS